MNLRPTSLIAAMLLLAAAHEAHAGAAMIGAAPVSVVAAAAATAARPSAEDKDAEALDDLEDAERSAKQAAAEAAGYTIRGLPGDNLVMAAPKLPSLDGYTHDAVLKKIQTAPAGKVVLRRMMSQDSLAEFTGGDERLAEWAKRQRSNPQAIFITGGYMTPRDLAQQLPIDQFAETEPGVFIARLPIVIEPGATLHVGKDVKDFRLSEDRGAFLINDGKLFITDTRLTAWRESTKTPATFRDGKLFRPFVLSWGGTETYVSRSVITSLGYAASKSYGFSISQYSPGMVDKMKRSHPTGWLIDSEFVDHWYGFYCYEAEDVAIVRNVYRDNIVYGIDPHDRSRRLVIAENTAFGTHKKHGIIVSREVNDSWIFRNRSYKNHLSGIVIDRSSVRNVVAYNESYDNESDGITIYESSDNLLWQNRVSANKRHGIRLRNSTDIELYGNTAVANGLSGIYGHIKDLTGTDRDLELDPFDARVSMVVVGGQMIANGTSPVSIDKPLSVELYDVEFLAPRKKAGIQLSGVLGQHQDLILDLLIRQKQAVMIEPEVKARTKTASSTD